MVGILRHWRIAFSALLSAVIIATAYMFAHSVESPQSAQASTETALLQAIAAKDSDGDGLPDWEEALYGTSPNTIDTFHLGMTDGEAVAKGLVVPRAVADVSVATSSQNSLDSNGLPPPPAEGTLTAVFAKNFFMLYLSAKQANGGADLTVDQVSVLATEALNQFSKSFILSTNFKTMSDIKISGTGYDALRAFAIAAEAILKKNTTDATMSEIQYLQSAIQDNDASALAHLASLAKAYRDTAVGIAMLPIPQEIANDILFIVNAIMRLSEIYNDFARVNIDPMTAMLALQQFRQTELEAERAFTALANTYVANGVILHNGTPGASFVNIMVNL